MVAICGVLTYRLRQRFNPIIVAIAEAIVITVVTYVVGYRGLSIITFLW